MLGETYKVVRENQLDLTGDSWIAFSLKVLNDDDYAYLYEDTYKSAFNAHVKNHISLVLDSKKAGMGNFQYAQCLPYDIYGPGEFRAKVKDDSDERYSPYLDEMQTNKPVSIDSLVAIGYPKAFLDEKEWDTVGDLAVIREALYRNMVNVPIVDSSYDEFADNYDCIKRYTLK